ncbi:MAG: hypothetical protein ABEH88_10915 [Halobacteriales archaeon]
MEELAIPGCRVSPSSHSRQYEDALAFGLVVGDGVNEALAAPDGGGVLPVDHVEFGLADDALIRGEALDDARRGRFGTYRPVFSGL